MVNLPPQTQKSKSVLYEKVHSPKLKKSGINNFNNISCDIFPKNSYSVKDVADEFILIWRQKPQRRISQTFDKYN